MSSWTPVLWWRVMVRLLRPGKAVDTDRLTNKEKETFPPEEGLWSDFRPQGARPWSVLSTIEQSIMEKMNAVGTPLKEWDIAIYRSLLLSPTCQLLVYSTVLAVSGRSFG